MAFDFEQPIVELEHRIEDIEKRLAEFQRAEGPRTEAPAADNLPAPGGGADEKAPPTLQTEIQRLSGDLARLRGELDHTRQKIYAELTPWQRVQIARHLERPHLLDYIRMIFKDWTEIHGDRLFADDPAMVCGYALFNGQPCAIAGQQKGSTTRENLDRNFGMAHPEGYRKALRVMKNAAKFGRPIIILIDTPGAYPGIGSEERGIAEAIARNMMEMFSLEVPIIVAVIGEGASGGAIGVGVGDAIMMFENSWYTVISPEGCASILWRDAKFAPQSAQALKLTGKDLLGLGIIDEVVAEPLGGAHRDPQQTAKNLAAAIARHLEPLMALPVDELLRRRRDKFRRMGKFSES
jgi:acetyl-CoA carboxylase carboxyl transferase subunit alpha